VIDHHPPRDDSIPDGVEFAILEEEYGATASIIADLMAANNIPIPEVLATTLAYGIKADTQDLGRETSEGDIRAYTHVYSLANKRLMSRIESARVPQNYFREFAKAIANAVIYDIAVVSDLGEIEVADMAAEMADFLLRLQGTRWSFVIGNCNDTLHLSLRASDEQLNSGTVIAEAVGDLGSCGGHAAMAGGQIPIKGRTEEEVDEIRESVFAGFLGAIKVKKSLRRPLVIEDLEDDEEEE
jgi:nanoRNase/pAp phosphatase (c-di-AMP/oligoRNAs hydrolase)